VPWTLPYPSSETINFFCFNLRSVFLTLWQHCGYTVATLWLHCGNTVVALWQHCGNTVVTLWQQCGYTVATLWQHCGYTVAILWLHCLWRTEVFSIQSVTFSLWSFLHTPPPPPVTTSLLGPNILTKVDLPLGNNIFNHPVHCHLSEDIQQSCLTIINVGM